MQEIFDILTSNYIINVVFFAWLTAQVLKTIINFILTKDFSLERLIGAGGMPSSHTALVISLVVATAKQCGYSSPNFAMALAFAAVVMYDAMGVRRAAGEQAKILNKMLDEWFVKAKITEQNVPQIKQLKELLGHTPIEVFGGAIVGLVVALIL
ncbi:MAG: divergent PAP2 family protein [Oscillospiraceae bacterium]